MSKKDAISSKKVNDYQILDHGIIHSQYFQGCGTSYTPYDDVATGIGDDFAEAIDDALEMLAQSGRWDVQELEARLKKEYGWEDKYPTTDSVSKMIEESKPERDEDSDEEDEESDFDDCCELYYHVSIRVN